MSFIGWLDHSEDEQRQMRELLAMFQDRGTVDDLGIGSVRDAISNRLFPGTSVIQTRARYFLFIPWIFEKAQRSKQPDRLVARAELMERKLIPALLAGGDHEGLIGRQAGKDVRTLPSSIYWSGLAAYGIFLSPGLTKVQYGRAVLRQPTRLEQDDELGERTASFWHREIPPPPSDFYDFEQCDFALTRQEATWLSERVLSTEDLRGPNLLGPLVRSVRGGADLPDGAFWAGPLPADTDPLVKDLVCHAARFSTAMHGAALLYNLLLASARGDAAKGDGERVEAMSVELGDWSMRAAALGVREWASDLGPFWAALRSSRTPERTRRFVEQWCALLADIGMDQVSASDPARALVEGREVEHKRAQARFRNRKRLDAWNGASGLVPLDFRWAQVRRFLSDLASGIQASSGPASSVKG